MNRYFCISTLAVLFALTSCDTAERQSVEGEFNRLATVKVSDGGAASLDFDKAYVYYSDGKKYYVKENYSPNNLRKVEDLDAFDLKNGDRGIARISYSIIPSADISKYSLESFTRIDPSHLEWGECPPDSVASYISFSSLGMGDASYPYFWAAGHHICISFSYYQNPDVPSEQNRFELYPRKLSNDTLSMLFYTDIPETAHNESSMCLMLMDYDLSEMSTVKHADASALMQQIRNLRKDSLYIKVSTCDSLTLLDGNQPMKVEGGSIVTRCAIDF